MMGWFLIIVGLFLIGFAVYMKLFVYNEDTKDLINRILKLSGKYSTDLNRFAARKESKAAHARADLATELNFEMERVVRLNEGQTLAETSIFDREHHQERLDLNYEVETANYELLLEQNQLTRQLVGKAATQEMDVATYLELKKKVEMDRLDLSKQWQEAEQQLKAGFIYQLQAHQHLVLMTEYIGKLYDRANQLRVDGKDREYRLIEEHIAFMEGDFRARQQRLVQTLEQENVQGGDEDTDFGGDGRDAVQTAQE